MIKQPKPAFHGVLRDGKLQMKDNKAFGSYLKSLVVEGREETAVTVTVKRFHRNRTDAQNKYYWGVVVPILQDYMGYDYAEEVHEALGYEHLRYKKGKYWLVKSTRKMSTVDFEAYMSLLRRWASREFGVNIPMPNEIDFDDIEIPFLL